MMLSMSEAILRLRWASCFGAGFEAFLRLWVCSHRIAQDMFVCTLIYACLGILVGFDILRSFIVFIGLFSSGPCAEISEECIAGPFPLAVSSTSWAGPAPDGNGVQDARCGRSAAAALCTISSFSRILGRPGWSSLV